MMASSIVAFAMDSLIHARCVFSLHLGSKLNLPRLHRQLFGKTAAALALHRFEFEI